VTPIYHITHLRNLPQIIASGGLYCDNGRANLPAPCIGIAHQHIKQRRANRRVPTCNKGTLADYVPFYFAPRSPMLYSISRGQVEGYTEGQQPVLHLVSSAEAVAAAGEPYTWTEGHAEMAFSEFYEGLADLPDKIDWEVMKATYWNDNPPLIVDRKRKRQAEFLVYRFFPWALFSTIGVINETARDEVLQMLHGAAHQPEVLVHRNWYY
jgi:ssDNA thymidine ADP-ribosyltransferase, DarT